MNNINDRIIEGTPFKLTYYEITNDIIYIMGVMVFNYGLLDNPPSIECTEVLSTNY